jgi:putative transposase
MTPETASAGIGLRIPHLSPARRRAVIEHVRSLYSISERRACSMLRQHRSTQRKVPRTRDDEAALTADIVELAKRYGRYRELQALAVL